MSALCQNRTHAAQQTTRTGMKIYAITSSARVSGNGGTVRPNMLAVTDLGALFRGGPG